MTTRNPELIEGPLIPQPPQCARLAHIFVNAANDLYDAATLDDLAQMWEEARAAASRVLAVCDSPAPAHHPRIGYHNP